MKFRLCFVSVFIDLTKWCGALNTAGYSVEIAVATVGKPHTAAEIGTSDLAVGTDP